MRVVTNRFEAAEAKENGDVIVATHGGPAVHADEASAAGLLQACWEDRYLTVFRVERDEPRDLAWALSNAAVVFDLGGQVEPGTYPSVVLDHHFLGLAAPRPAQNELVELGGDPATATGKDYQAVVDAYEDHAGKRNRVPFSSAGLVRGHLSRLRYTLADDRAIRAIIASIDASDNGIAGVEHGVPRLVEGIAMEVHNASPVRLSGGELNVYDTAEHFRKVAEAFAALFTQRASWVASFEFSDGLVAMQKDAEAGRQASRDRVQAILDTAGSPVLVLTQYEAEALNCLGERANSRPVLYLVFPSAGRWMVQQAPKGPMPCFEGKKPLPKAWAGLREQELDAVVGIPGCVFVHPGRFIGGHRTYEGAVAMAWMAAALPE